MEAERAREMLTDVAVIRVAHADRHNSRARSILSEWESAARGDGQPQKLPKRRESIEAWQTRMRAMGLEVAEYAEGGDA